MSTYPSVYLPKSIKSSCMSPFTSQAQDMSHTCPRRMVNHPFLPTGPTPYWLVCHTVSSGNCFHKSLLLEIPSGHVEGCTVKVIAVDLFWGTHGRIPVQSSKLVVVLCFNGQYDPCYRINVPQQRLRDQSVALVEYMPGTSVSRSAMQSTPGCTPCPLLRAPVPFSSRRCFPVVVFL